MRTLARHRSVLPSRSCEVANGGSIGVLFFDLAPPLKQKDNEPSLSAFRDLCVSTRKGLLIRTKLACGNMLAEVTGYTLASVFSGSGRGHFDDKQSL